MTDFIDDLRAQMRASTEHDQPSDDLLDRVHGGRARTQRRRVAMAGTALVGVATLGALAIGQGGGEPTQVIAPVASATASVLAQVPPTDAQIAVAQWWSWKTTSYTASVPSYRESDPSVTEPTTTYVSRDGRTVLVDRPGAAPVLAAEKSTAFTDVAAPPTGPIALRAALIEDRVGTSPPSHYLPRVVWDTLQLPASLALRTGLVEVLRAEPGITETAGQDSQARPGTVFTGSAYQGDTWQVVIDSNSLRLLEATFRPADDTVAGKVFQRWTYAGWSVEDPPPPFGS